MVGFGTYRLKGKEGEKAIRAAIEAGYSIFDTATFYGNFDALGGAMKDRDRQKFYIISKVWHDQQSPERLKKDLQQTLAQSHMHYLDAYLIHWPNSAVPIEATLGAMDELRQEKKIRHIGLSNVTVNHLKKALKVGVPITWVQVEMHPFFYDPALLDLCRERSITVQAWRPLYLGRVGEDSELALIAKKHGKTVSQVALRWIMQHGSIPLPSSKNREHMEENLNARNFVLSEEEMRQIDARAVKGARYRLTLESGVGFTDEFDLSYEQCWPDN
jgi:diketogulonate reductase-like aldo/keto reductase